MGRLFNKYMFSYVVTNIDKEKLRHIMGTKEAISHYNCRKKLEDEIEKNFPSAAGWELKSLLVDDEPLQFLEESGVAV
jgi:hypothetical protein